MNNNSLFQTLQSYYRQGIRHKKYRWLIILGTLAYLASPVDLAPDLIPGLGWVDDGILVTLLVTEVSQLLVEQLKTRRQGHGNDPSKTATAQVVDVDVETVSVS
jgi:uncharacterized membrane protein YkvA (DUF1232 family)